MAQGHLAEDFLRRLKSATVATPISICDRFVCDEKLFDDAKAIKQYSDVFWASQATFICS